jgi:hypothetical protein
MGVDALVDEPEWKKWDLYDAFYHNSYRDEWIELLKVPTGPQVGEKWESSDIIYDIVALFEADGVPQVVYRNQRYPNDGFSIIRVEQFMKDCKKVPPKPKYVVGKFYTDSESQKLVLFCDREDHFQRMNKCPDRSGYDYGVKGYGSGEHYEREYGTLQEIILKDDQTLTGTIDS